MRSAFIAVVVCLCVTAAGMAAPAKKNKPKFLTMVATAHSVEGTTASGTQSRPGTAAADPAVLPLGTRIRIRVPNGNLGEYLVTDTGPMVKGRHVDLFMANEHDAKEFGKHRVRVEVLEWGEGKTEARAEDRQDRRKGRGHEPNVDMVK